MTPSEMSIIAVHKPHKEAYKDPNIISNFALVPANNIHLANKPCRLITSVKDFVADW